MMSGAFRMTRRVQFAETDAAAVMHFANYYRLMEETEHAFWRSLGLDVLTVYKNQQLSWPRVATSCEYFAPAYFEDELELFLTVVRVGSRSVTFAVEFRRDGQRLAAGRITAACSTMAGGVFASTPIPGFIREKLAPLVRSGANEVE